VRFSSCCFPFGQKFAAVSALLSEGRVVEDIIARIDAHLAECAAARCQDEEPDREPILRECRDEIIAARACAEIMLQGTGQRLAESMAERVINGQTVGAWIPVSERLPDRGWDGFSQIVVVAAGNSYFLGRYYKCDQGDECHECGANLGEHWFIETTEPPTHWMPLPEPPA